MLYPFTKKKVKIFYKTIDQLAFFQFIAKYAKESFLKSTLIVCNKINFLYNVSLVFSLVILPIVHAINSSFDCDPTIDVSEVFSGHF